MTSSIINFILNKFLSNFLEINSNQTYISLLSGEIILKNIKIKKKAFEYINIDYLELINGYIGSLKIILQMPNFYSNSIKIYINDLYLHSKQKQVKNINEKERLESLKLNKSYKLSTEELLSYHIDEINNEGENFINQIINNTNIFINNIVIRFEDDTSNQKIPFSVGIITKSVNIISSIEFFESDLNNNLEQNSISRRSSKIMVDTKNVYISDNPNEICDKKIIVDKFYFYMDTFDNSNELQYDRLIDENMKIKTSENFENYINDIYNFYVYCQSELNVHRNDKKSHEYIFYKLNLDINFSMNFELENNNPQYQININKIDNFDIYLTIKQISSFFNLLSYYNLYYYYQIGLNKSMFNLNLNQTEKKTYILEYIDYFYSKYTLQNNKYNLSKEFIEKEEKMAYEEISKLRKIAIKNKKLYKEIKEIEEKLNKSKKSWILKPNEKEIIDLEKQLNNLKRLLNEKIIKSNKENLYNNSNLYKKNSNLSIDENSVKENNPYDNLPDNFIFILIQINIKKSNIIIFDDQYDDNIDTENIYKKIIDIDLTNFFIKMTISKKMFNLYFDLDNIGVTQEIIKSKDYDILIMTKPINNKKVLIFEFEINQNENYTYKIVLKNERKIIFILNLYEIQYLLYKILGAIFTSISFVDLSHYAKENVNKYLRIGFLVNEEKYKKNKSIKKYYNYCCSINILSPLIIIPQNILDINNNKCIIINLGDISLESNLVSSSIRKYLLDAPKNTNELEVSRDSELISLSSSFSDSNNSDDLYDIYNLSIKGFNALSSNECIKENLFNSRYSSSIINETDISILYKTLIIPEDKKLNTSYLNISIGKIELNLDEFQILLLIVFSKQMRAQSQMLYKMQQEKEKELNITSLNRLNTVFIESFKEHLIEKGILSKEESINESNNDEQKKDRIKSYAKEEDFFNKKNEYFYQINIDKIQFSIYKRYPDLSKSIFLEMEIDSFDYIMCGNKIKDSLMKLNMKNLKLYDKEKNINKDYSLIKEYQTLIKHNSKNLNDDKENMFSYSMIYINELKESICELTLCNIDIIITFDSITRIYIFSMYYYKIFYENYLNAYSHIEFDTKNNLNNSLLKIDKEEKLKTIPTLMKYNSKLVPKKHTKEITKNKFIFKIRIVDNYILLPYDPISLDCPILSLKLNMFYDQSSDGETMKIFDTKKKLIQNIIRPNNSYLNLMIYESNFDIIKYNKEIKGFIFNEKNNKIISNFRILFTYKYSNEAINKQSLSEINILIEPIMINICLDHLKDILIFYNQSMKFLYENLYEYYIPYIKPENVVYHQGKEYVKKKKITFKKLANRVFVLIKIRKSFDKNKKIINNENLLNSVSNININMDKSTVTIFDNDFNDKRLLLEIILTKMIFKSINNTNPKNTFNITNELISIITGTTTILPHSTYIVNKLYKYMDISFIFEFNYYNIEYSAFEPIIEPLPFQYLSYQVDKIFRHRTIIKSDNMLNFNMSSNCIKVLNLFLCKYYSEEVKNMKSSKIKLEETNNAPKNKPPQKKDKIVLKLINKTGLPIKFWFNFKSEEKYTINNKEYLKFSYKELYKTKREQIKIQQKYPDKNSFSFQILDFDIISNINLNRNSVFYFKTKISDNKYLFYNVIIDTSGLVKIIKFSSSIVFKNKTIFEELLISIDDNKIKDNYILLKKDKKVKIPLSWMLSGKKIYIQLKKENERHILYNSILESAFCQKLKDEELEKIKNEKKKVKENLTNPLNSSKEINLQHPKYKEYISSYLGQKFNINNNYNTIKKFTIIDEKDSNKSYSFNFNYLALSYNEKNNKYISDVYKKLEKTEKSYKYLIIIRPIISISNYIPFNIILNEGTNKKDIGKTSINISPLKTKEIYDINWILNKKSLFMISLNYDNIIFKSNNFPLMEDTHENLLKKVILRDKNSNTLISNILVKKITEESDSILEVIEQFSISSIHFILFFDYIINNRMHFNIYAKEPTLEQNKTNNSINIFKNNKLSILSSTKDIHILNISADNKNFNEKNQFILNSIGLNKNIDILKDNKKYNISCITLNSADFIYSNIIIFEPKYILINNLDFDIFYTQIAENKKLVSTIKKNEKRILSLKEDSDKKLFKFGIRTDKKYSWSGNFDIDDSKDYDYKIEITKELMEKYKKHSYTCNSRHYLYFRIIFKIFQNTTYIFLSFPEFPYLAIKNRTSETIIIHEDQNDSPIIVKPRIDIPFIWNDVANIKDKLICQIRGENNIFSFSSFEENKIKINENKKEKYINIAVRRSRTGSRYLILEEQNDNKLVKSNFLKKQLQLLSEMIVDLKGIGLSFLDETPKEIFFISFYGIKLIYKTTLLLKNKEKIEDIFFYLKNFQIDYCLNDSLKSLIYPKNQIIPSLEELNNEDKENIEFIKIIIERASYNNLENNTLYMNYNEIYLSIQEINVKINQIILMNLINLIQGYTALFDYTQKIKKKNIIYIKEDNLIENNEKYIDILLKENRDSNKILINYLKLDSLKINITFRIDLSNIEISFLPDIISNTIISLGSSLIRITESPLRFSPKVAKDIYMDTNVIISFLIKEFKSEGIFQIYKILGSTDLIGNPVNLIDKIGNGIFDLVKEPTKGLMQGPTQFGKGLEKGVKGLVTGVVGGTMDSVTKITGTLYTTVHGISGKKNKLLKDNDEEDEPENLLVGATKGIEGGYEELKEGLTGFFINPFQRAQKSGAVGFIEGLSTGIFGLAISPFAFALRLGGSLAAGTKNTFSILLNKSLKNKRFRFPRYIEESKPLQNYDGDLSAAKEFLSKLIHEENPIILYFSSFICNNEGYEDKLAFIIITNHIFLIISYTNKILLNINISELIGIKLYYEKNNFVVIFEYKNKSKKMINFDKSSVIVACQFYEILKGEINALKEKS